LEEKKDTPYVWGLSRWVAPTVMARLVGGADGNGEVGIARVVDRQGEAGAGEALARGEVPVAGIAGGDDDDDARAHEPVHLHADRALAAGEPLGVELVSQTQIDAMDPLQLAFAVDLFPDVLQRPQDVGRRVGVGPGLVGQYLEADQFAARRDAG
jgi:hypothetical protein